MQSCILGHGMQRMAIRGHFCRRDYFVFVRGYSLLSVGIRGDLCSMAISFAVHGYLFSVSWLLVAILAIRGYSWLFH